MSFLRSSASRKIRVMVGTSRWARQAPWIILPELLVGAKERLPLSPRGRGLPLEVRFLGNPHGIERAPYENERDDEQDGTHVLDVVPSARLIDLDCDFHSQQAE